MSSFENPKLKESFCSRSVTRTSPARDSESRVASSRPAKPAPRITTCFIAVTTITRTARSFDLFAQRSGQVLLGRKQPWRKRERRDSNPRPQRERPHAHEEVNRETLLTPCLRGMGTGSSQRAT